MAHPLFRVLAALWLTVTCLLAGGCGYRLAHGGEEAPVFAGKTVAVPLFGNRTYRPNVETVLTEELLREFSLRTGGKVVPPAAADIVISGTVLSYGTAAVAYTGADLIREYRTELTAEAMAVERQTNKVLWKGRLTDRQEYPADRDISLQLNRESAALRDLCRRLAQRVYRLIGEDF